jgi:predicted RNase H-like HicB family nuclease
MNYDYSVHIVWSQEDGAYLAAIHELPGCISDGQTAEEALKNVKVIAQEWIEVANEEGRQIPPPMSIEDCREEQKKFHRSINAHIKQVVSELVPKIVDQILKDEEESQPWRCGPSAAWGSGRGTVQVRLKASR